MKVSGSGVFGEWKQPMALNARENGDWEVTLIIPNNAPDAEYKYFVEELGGTTTWEGGLNRIARISEVAEGQMMEIRDTWRVCTLLLSPHGPSSYFISQDPCIPRSNLL